MTADDDSSGKAPEVPERIKEHAPRPELRPGGSWRAMADEVDRVEREKHDAAKARSAWAARLDASRRRGLGYRLTKDSAD